MRKLAGFLAGLALVVASGGVASASSYVTNTPVPILVVDRSPAAGVTVTLSDFSFGGGSLSYSLNGAGWTSLGGPTTISDIAGDTVLNFRLTTSSSVNVLLSGATSETFQGDVVLDSVWNTVIVNWGSYGSVTVASANSCDGFAPVPIPGALVLLGSGLAGVVVVGRRRLKPEGGR